jgi:hypothetical protein
MLTRGAIIGTAILCDVKQYKNKTEREIDKNKHYADIKKFGFCRYGVPVIPKMNFATTITNGTTANVTIPVCNGVIGGPCLDPNTHL